MIRLLIAFLLPLLTASQIDPYHNPEGGIEASEQSTLYAGNSNAGIWDNTDWRNLANEELARAIEVASNVNNKKAKNVIMFLGDGMGVSTLAAARLYNAETSKLKGKQMYLTWEKFPHAGFSRTYNVDRSTPDSAGTATAYLCGVKANYGTIGVTEDVKLNNCSAVNNQTKVRSILKESIKAGKWTGVVTTTAVTHASPAGAYAHVASRSWEARIPSTVVNREQCDDIAKQLIQDDENKNIRVILGGGRQMFLPNTENSDYNNENGEREDGTDLIKEWQQLHPNGTFVMNQTHFNSVDPEKTEYLLGLFSKSHMDYEADRNPSEQPSLSEMTEKAIKILQKSSNGYFLFVEGGKIDHSHHSGSAFKALHDTVALSEAVQKAINITDANDTLIVVTADHSHVFTFGGYGTFKTSIFDATDSGLAQDGKPYLQLHYANGPGFKDHRTVNGNLSDSIQRINPSSMNTTDTKFRQDAAVPLSSETHGGEDVAIFASGPMAHLIHGVHEQNYIARLMMYASCVGSDPGPHCLQSQTSGTTTLGSTATTRGFPSTTRGSTATALSFNLFLIVSAAIFNFIR